MKCVSIDELIGRFRGLASFLATVPDPQTSTMNWDNFTDSSGLFATETDLMSWLLSNLYILFADTGC